jgi:hypothetical protein
VADDLSSILHILNDQPTPLQILSGHAGVVHDPLDDVFPSIRGQGSAQVQRQEVLGIRESFSFGHELLHCLV